MSIQKKIYSGFPFLYIETTSTKDQLEAELKHAASKAMKGKRLSCEIVFVRFQSPDHIYRARFYVPQEKLFCCGNGCTDCVRLKNRH